MHPRFVRIIRARRPLRIERVLHSRRGVQRVRRMVVRINDRSRAATAVHRLERRHPAVLGKVVVVQTRAYANYRPAVVSKRVSDSQPWLKLLPIIRGRTVRYVNRSEERRVGKEWKSR